MDSGYTVSDMGRHLRPESRQISFDFAPAGSLGLLYGAETERLQDGSGERQ